MNTVIINAKIVNEGQVVEGDLSVEGERIKGINVSHPSNPKIIDARGAWLIPGMIVIRCTLGSQVSNTKEQSRLNHARR